MAEPERSKTSRQPKRRFDASVPKLDSQGQLPSERGSPANLDAEEGLLACCILETGQEIITQCIEAKITPDYFFKPAHQLLFEAIRALYSAQSGIDEIILAEKLNSMGHLEAVGGHAEINRLTNRVETTAHARYWLEIVREKALLRKLISTATGIVERCYSSQEDLDNLLESAEQSIFRISQDRVSESARHVKDSIDSAVTLVNNMLLRKGEITGVPSGFTDLDRMTFGFHPTEMIVLAARPSVGKTSFAMNIAENVLFPQAPRKPVGVLVFSLEMGADQLAMRLLCCHSKVNMKKLKEGFISKEDQANLVKSAQALKNSPLWIDDASQVTIMEIRAKARRLHTKNPLGLIVIDYLQLLSGTDPKMPREQQIAEISRGIKGMAKELKIPVIVLSQLNRESEKEKRAPRLSDLRESGSIEQDADVVMILARTIQKEGEEGKAMQEDNKRSLIIAKQRNGPIGDINLTFIADLTRFENYVPPSAGEDM